MKREPTEHTDWCARDHRCNLSEHRSDEITVDMPGYGRAVLSRVRGADGREHAEIRARVVLHPADPVARRQVARLLKDLRDMLARASQMVRAVTAAARKELTR